jgi:uncharacterized protein YcfJ
MKKMLLIGAVALSLAGCGPTRQDSALTGAAVGGAAGAVIGGAATGHAGGALAGAAVGAATGAVIGASAGPRCWNDPYYGRVCER